MTSTTHFNPALHGLRGLAALAVLLFHWDQFYPALGDSLAAVEFLGGTWNLAMQVRFGWLGVHLFFALSGYLLASQLMTRQLSMGTVRYFYFRRVMRIYPAAWLQLGILLLVGLALPQLFQLPSVGQLAANIFLWINIPGSMVAPFNGVWWTLPIELGFYLILPVLVLLARRWGWAAVAVVSLLVTLAWRLAVFIRHDLDNYLAVLPLLDFLPGSLSSFVMGAFVANLPTGISASRYATGVSLTIIALLGLQYWQLSLNDVYWTGHWILVVWVPFVAVVIAAIVYFCAQPRGVLGFLKAKPLVWLGEVSYGIYLWHFPILLVLRQLLPDYGAVPIESAALLILVLFSSLLTAALSFYGVERYAMRIGR